MQPLSGAVLVADDGLQEMYFAAISARHVDNE